MRFCLLSSGSKGNCVFVESQGQAVLVDAGLSYLELSRRAAKAGVELSRAKAILVTHEHSDHVRGVGVAARKLKIPVMATEGTAGAAGAHFANLPGLELFKSGSELDFGFLKAGVFSGSHDAADPVVLSFSGSDGARLGLATDLGVMTHLVREAFKDLDALILEFNHDPKMLIDGPYPLWLKQRVRGRRGHLSNEQAAEALGHLLSPRLKTVALAHLSEVNNTPELALAAALGVPGTERLRVSAAGQWAPTELFEI
ncbi:MAG: MBL fold metallo-hydrolase [Deltaproteobacteria bacterium]|jgi:phosphoribosyl 1,2-cyclic phosphodiesterase|nr:MBL fold metallo-hydrolase [Deltaproteobacteria bacterium]